MKRFWLSRQLPSRFLFGLAFLQQYFASKQRRDDNNYRTISQNTKTALLLSGRNLWRSFINAKQVFKNGLGAKMTLKAHIYKSSQGRETIEVSLARRKKALCEKILLKQCDIVSTSSVVLSTWTASKMKNDTIFSCSLKYLSPEAKRISFYWKILFSLLFPARQWSQIFVKPSSTRTGCVARARTTSLNIKKTVCGFALVRIKKINSY